MFSSFFFVFRHFGKKIPMGDRISKLGAGREQRQIAPGISSWGWGIQYLIKRCRCCQPTWRRAYR
jgi:hypothetical protein